MEYSVFLAGEIHTDWRTELSAIVSSQGLPIEFVGPVTDHDESDDCGATILGEESSPFWRDRKGAGINAMRTRVMIEAADLIVVKFGDKYRQWNAAFDAGFAFALNKPIIVVHPPELQHALKEIDAAACAVAENIEQVAEILSYIARQESWQVI